MGETGSGYPVTYGNDGKGNHQSVSASIKLAWPIGEVEAYGDSRQQALCELSLSLGRIAGEINRALLAVSTEWLRYADGCQETAASTPNL